MDEDQVAAWLVEWFSGRAEVGGETLEERKQLDFFAAQLIDSLGVIELIAAVEERFAIRFTEEDFQDRSFSRIGGLAELVCRRRGG